MALESKVVAITGAASGIGQATAILLAAHGACLSLADVNENALKVTAPKLQSDYPKCSAFTAAVDVRSQQDCLMWIEATVAHFRKPLADVANLAGVFGRSIGRKPGAIRNITDEEFDWVMEVNVRGTLNCLRAELPHMQVGRSGRGGGSIVNATSVAGICGGPLNGPYVASKHAVVGITRTAAKEEGTRAIRINAIAPGIIATPMIRQIEEAAGQTDIVGEGDPGALARKGDAQEVAEVIMFLLSPQSSFVNGAVIPVDGGWVC
jgi:NAD(P)-dependent dehydrogenase (short-subunit alcohol dehydrogenase family)